VQRVQAWRAAHPGYSRLTQQRNTALHDPSLAQVPDLDNKTATLSARALQDILSSQTPVLIGLIATLGGLSLQDDIVGSARRLLRLGEDILAYPSKTGGQHAKASTGSNTATAHSPPVQLDRSTTGP